MTKKLDRTPRARRVFLTRHYISVTWFDVMASTDAEARRKATKAAYKLKPDPRAQATDNGWIPDAPVILEAGIGSSVAGISEVVEILPGVFHNKD